jgi:RimJ/RimL family protein N-acetyltransferase
MKINSTTKLEYGAVILIPYREHHVIKYHDWMCSEELQTLTASEPLSLDEEYAMQKEWHNDEEKLTFIVLSKKAYEHDQTTNKTIREIDAMIGDVNAFFSVADPSEVELDIMIAEKEHQGFGCGTQSICLIIYYILLNFTGINQFIVKINETNQPSIRLFEKLGFTQYDYLGAFKQICMKLVVNENRFAAINSNVCNINEINIDPNYV